MGAAGGGWPVELPLTFPTPGSEGNVGPAELRPQGHVLLVSSGLGGPQNCCTGGWAWKEWPESRTGLVWVGSPAPLPHPPPRRPGRGHRLMGVGVGSARVCVAASAVEPGWSSCTDLGAWGLSGALHQLSPLPTQPVARDPVVCHPDLEEGLQAWPADLPDEFFELTVDDVRRRLAQLRSERWVHTWPLSLALTPRPPAAPWGCMAPSLVWPDLGSRQWSRVAREWSRVQLVGSFTLAGETPDLHETPCPAGSAWRKPP